jgi:hypothetical protein
MLLASLTCFQACCVACCAGLVVLLGVESRGWVGGAGPCASAGLCWGVLLVLVPGEMVSSSPGVPLAPLP